ncbi:hypothetical protein J7E97_08100 [Streptomyces sp. ISL-66]|uniref:DUF6197 family protein n=1 Tax=Streptomyces sp. ISL-66 TaxID=2819186 RepID=UPI001BE7098B|nr:hypothetical protein [Streptomyces sp. ISL-66]MBT2467835.1 hypothetical protein [Streptomyces sp. ISL-66]
MRTLTAPARRTPAPVLDLEARLALMGPLMEARLGAAGLEIAVNLAPITIPDVVPGPPILPAWQPAYSTPVAQLLERAAHRIGEVGWSRQYLRETSGAVCVLGAIRDAARGTGLVEAATSTLLDQITATAPDILSIGAWNQAQSGPAPVIRMLGAAAREADRRNQ